MSFDIFRVISELSVSTLPSTKKYCWILNLLCKWFSSYMEKKSAWSILHGNTKLWGSLIAHNAHMINCFLKLRCKWVNDFLLNWGRLGSCLQKRGQQTISNFLTREWKKSNWLWWDFISILQAVEASSSNLHNPRLLPKTL